MDRNTSEAASARVAMAHVGKPWKLHFRRDFNMNVITYRRGMPEAWTGDVGVYTEASLPIRFERTTWIARNTTPISSHQQVWQTDAFASHGRTLIFEIEIDLSVLDNFYPKPTIRLRKANQDEVAKYSCIRGNPQNANLGSFGEPLAYLIDWDRPYWDNVRPGMLFFANAAVWSQYPP